MSLKNFRRKGWLIFLFQALWGTLPVLAQSAPPQIAFLHLKMESNQVALVSASTSPGVLKRLPEHGPGVQLEVATSTGQVLWTNTIADPSVRHLEYEDPEHPGAIISKEVQLTNAEFTIRVPVFPEAHHVNFFRALPEAGTNAPGTKPHAVEAPGLQRKSLGTVLLPQKDK
jgi:hypothetical protein